jgi:hypothetical protein
MDFERPPWLPSESQARLLKACLADDDSWKTSWLDWRERAGTVQPDAVSIKLLPLIHWKLGSTALDDPLHALAQSVYLQTLAQNLRREAHLADIVGLLEEAGVETMLLKGAASSTAYYPSRGLRDMADIDLLVRPDDVGRAVDILVQQRWRPYLDAPHPEIQRQIRVRHAWSFTLDTENEIDLHWRPVSYCYAPDVAASFWRHARLGQVAGTAVQVPAPTEQLFHVCAHAVHLTWVPSVRWIADAMTILRQGGVGVDWERLEQLAGAASMTLRLREALSYLRREFGAPIPDEMLGRLAAAQTVGWERREAALHRRRPPLGVWDYLQWRWCHFRRVRPFDARWRRLPAFAGFVSYLRVWGRTQPVERARRFARMRASIRPGVLLC